VSESYDENYHPNRRKEDRYGRHVSINRQVNITLKAGAIAENGKLVIYVGDVDNLDEASSSRRAMIDGDLDR
jgi:hypothetical protein